MSLGLCRKQVWRASFDVSKDKSKPAKVGCQGLANGFADSGVIIYRSFGK